MHKYFWRFISFDLRCITPYSRKGGILLKSVSKQQVSIVSIYPRLSTCFKCTESFPLSNKAGNIKSLFLSRFQGIYMGTDF